MTKHIFPTGAGVPYFVDPGTKLTDSATKRREQEAAMEQLYAPYGGAQTSMRDALPWAMADIASRTASPMEDRAIAETRAPYAGAQSSMRDALPLAMADIASRKVSPMEDRLIGETYAPYGGAQSSMRDALIEENTPLNPWEQFWADQNAYREEQIQRRTDAGVVPSEGVIDWEGLRYDLNAPYRDRIQRELESQPPPFDPVQELEKGYEERQRLAEQRTADALGVPAASKIRPAWTMGTSFGANSLERLAEYRPPIDEITGVDPALVYDPDAYTRPLTDTGPVDATEFARDTAIPLPRRRPATPEMQVADVPLPRRRPFTGSGGVDVASVDLPGMVPGAQPVGSAGIAPTAADLEEAATGKKSLWDSVVEGAGSVLEHGTLGSITKSLFPDLWYGMGESIKDMGSGTGSGSSGRGQHLTPEQTLSMMADYGSTFNDDRGPSGSSSGQGSGGGSGGGDNNGGGSGGGGGGGTVVPPPPPPASVAYDRLGNVVFPDLPPYNPGVDPEWLYFRNRNYTGTFANGGIVNAYAEGGEVNPTGGQDPRVTMIADAEDALEAIAAGEKPEDDDVKALKEFVKTFGDEALRKLDANVKAGMKMRAKRGPRMIEGPGGPTDDAIPAQLDNGEPAALSDGEFVIPADAVVNAGKGDRDAGAAQLQQLSEMLQAAGPGAPR